jgi:hypothetical protein
MLESSGERRGKLREQQHRQTGLRGLRQRLAVLTLHRRRCVPAELLQLQQRMRLLTKLMMN